MAISLLAQATVPVSYGYMQWDVTNHIEDALYNGLSNVDFLVKFHDEALTSRLNFRGKDYASNQPILAIDGVNIAANKDTMMAETLPTTNYGSSTSVELNSPIKERNVISFPLTGVSSVTSATLNLYYFYGSNAAGKIVSVYKLTRSDWEEFQSTWNIYKTGSSWTAAGGDYTDVSNIPTGTPVTFNADLLRQVAVIETINTDTYRKTSIDQTFSADALRKVVTGVSQLFNIDTLRQVIKGETVSVDAKRSVILSEIISVDTVRKLLYGSIGGRIIYCKVNDSIGLDLSVTDTLTLSLKVAD